MSCPWKCLLFILGVHLTLGQERRTGNTCSHDLDCPDNAFCRASSFCVCKDGYIINPYNVTHRECIREAQFGESCLTNIQCQTKLGTQAECVAGKCACKPTAHLEGTRCYETVLIGGRCTVNENCYLGDRDYPEMQAFCYRGFCSCQLLYSPRDGGTRCVKDARLGERCEDELQCAGSGLECREGSCHCRDGWIATDFADVCVESVRQLGGYCDWDVQCEGLAGGAGGASGAGAALCLGGVCNCSWTAHAAGAPARCWHSRLPGAACLRDEECVDEEGGPGYCKLGRCTCDTCAPDPRDFASGAILHSLAPSLLLLPALALLRLADCAYLCAKTIRAISL